MNITPEIKLELERRARQTRDVHERLQKMTYLHAKEICKYVKTQYNIDYTSSGITFWLKSQGFVFKEPIKVLW